MNKFLSTLTVVCALCFTACAQKKTNMETSKVLVTYFSATGTTSKVARDIADVSGGDQSGT